VEHVAGLANLELTEEEIDVYTKQLRDILGYVEKLQKVDTTGVEPTYQTIDGTVNGWREDEVRPSLTQAEALSGAKRVAEGCFVTENVFEFNKARPSVTKAGPFLARSNRDKYNAILTEIFNTEGSDLSSASLQSAERSDPSRIIGHKDLFLTKGVETTAGSRVLEGFLPQYSATVVEKLEKAGYRAKYKFNCDAWAHGSSGENSDFGATKNPWSQEFTPGGSSSGSAAAVAAGMVDLATGTDTGGSIRLPASFCGVTGLKPTYGVVSRYGIVAMASSLDSPGVIGRTVEEVEKAFKVMAGEDERDATLSSKFKVQSSKSSSKFKVIGIPKEYFSAGVDDEVKSAVMEAVSVLKENGFKIKEITLPNSKYGIAVYYLVQTTEAASNLGRYDGIRYGQDRSFFGAEAKRRIMLGTFASSAGYSAKFFEKAARVRTLIIKDFENAFNPPAGGVDVLIGPVSPTPPFKLGEKTDDPLQMYLSDILTVPVNLAGLPALALPCGFTKDNLPIGMQLIGPRWGEEMLFEVGKVYQRLTEWHRRRQKDKKD